MTKNIIHIYICYHKNSYIVSDTCLKPIFVGKALSTDCSEIPGDNTGDHISEKNKEYCELTALYWAWKNDHQADWIGLMHYRRFFNFSQKKFTTDRWGCVFSEELNKETCQKFGLNQKTINYIIKHNPSISAILPKKWSTKKEGFKDIQTHYNKSPHHYPKDLMKTREIIKEIYPDDLKYFDLSMNNDIGYFTNMFILKKDVFNEYCEWLFNILSHLEKNTDMTNYSSIARRLYGYLGERLFNVFMNLPRNKKIKSLELDRVFFNNTTVELSHLIPSSPPAPPANAVSIVIACDENFVPHLAALIESIKDSFNYSRFLDLIIFDGGIYFESKKLIKRQFYAGLKSGNITFINCKDMYKDISIHMHFSTSTFYRISIGEILKNHKRALYIDCDTIVLEDLSKLWDTDLGDKAIAAAPDIIMKSFINTGVPAMQEAGGAPARLYLQEYVKLGQKINQYFQAGVILFDLDKFRELNLTDLAIEMLNEKKYWFLDQDILNKLLLDNVKFIDTSWNCINTSENIYPGLDQEWKEKLKDDLREPKIIHYAGYEAKPWNNPSAYLSHYYWYFSRRTFWYEKFFNPENNTLHHPQPHHPQPHHHNTIYKISVLIWRKIPCCLRSRLIWIAHPIKRILQ